MSKLTEEQQEFSNEHLKGRLICTPPEFIQAKLDDYAIEHGVDAVEFDGSLTQEFITYVHELLNGEDDFYAVDELWEQWDKALDEAAQ